MDELLAVLLKAQISLEDFDQLLYGTSRSLRDEVEQLRKEMVPVHEINTLSNDIRSFETFHAVSVSQMREYFQEKINLLKAYLNED